MTPLLFQLLGVDFEEGEGGGEGREGETCEDVDTCKRRWSAVERLIIFEVRRLKVEEGGGRREEGGGNPSVDGIREMIQEFKLRGKGQRRERTVVSCVQGKMSDLKKQEMASSTKDAWHCTAW